MKSFKLNPVEKIAAPVNHYILVDVSGSMYNTLPKLRTHLKTKLTQLVKPTDTVSIIYFADNSCCGVAAQHVVIANQIDFINVCNAIDKYLTPHGCTSFVPPLNKAIELSNSFYNGNINNMIFMTDGYDNCNKTHSILESTKKLTNVFAGIAIIEYGWYCNRELLTKMAELTGAVHVFAEYYEDYEPVVESLLSNQTSVRVPVTVGTPHAIYITNGRVVLTSSDGNGIVYVPEDVSVVYAPEVSVSPEADVESLYIAVYYGVFLGESDLVWDALKYLGDVALIKAYTNCFTKQDYTNFNELVSSCIIDEGRRFVDGIDHNMVPDENASTVIDLLNVLQKGNNKLAINHQDFFYTRIGRARTQAQDDAINKMHQQMMNTTDKAEIVELATKIATHEEWTPEFVGDSEYASFGTLVFNSTRPNISVSTTVDGTVSIPESKQSEFKLPEKIDTHIFRNYTIVKDGIINLKKLPVVLDKETYDTLVNMGAINNTGYFPDYVYTIEVGKYPLINRNMVKNLSIVDLFTTALQIEELSAKQKVINSFIKTTGNRVGLTEQFGADAANWLSENGIRDYGFSPKTVASGETTDVYLSKELSVKLSGLSSLPSLAAVQTKINNKKTLNAGDYLISKYVALYSNIGETPSESQLEMLRNDKKDCSVKLKELSAHLAKMIYAVVVGKKWFTDAVGMEDYTRTITLDGFGDVVCKAVLEEKEIKI